MELVDERFLKYLLPAITMSSWPRLRRMELLGVAGHSTVGIWRRHESLSVDCNQVNLPLCEGIQRSIREAIGPTVDLEIREDAERVFWLAAEELPTGIPSLRDYLAMQ